MALYWCVVVLNDGPIYRTFGVKKDYKMSTLWCSTAFMLSLFIVLQGASFGQASVQGQKYFPEKLHASHSDVRAFICEASDPPFFNDDLNDDLDDDLFEIFLFPKTCCTSMSLEAQNFSNRILSTKVLFLSFIHVTAGVDLLSGTYLYFYFVNCLLTMDPVLCLRFLTDHGKARKLYIQMYGRFFAIFWSAALGLYEPYLQVIRRLDFVDSFKFSCCLPSSSKTHESFLNKYASQLYAYIRQFDACVKYQGLKASSKWSLTGDLVTLVTWLSNRALLRGIQELPTFDAVCFFLASILVDRLLSLSTKNSSSVPLNSFTFALNLNDDPSSNTYVSVMRAIRIIEKYPEFMPLYYCEFERIAHALRNFVPEDYNFMTKVELGLVFDSLLNSKATIYWPYQPSSCFRTQASSGTTSSALEHLQPSSLLELTHALKETSYFIEIPYEAIFSAKSQRMARLYRRIYDFLWSIGTFISPLCAGYLFVLLVAFVATCIREYFLFFLSLFM